MCIVGSPVCDTAVSHSSSDTEVSSCEVHVRQNGSAETSPPSVQSADRHPQPFQYILDPSRVAMLINYAVLSGQFKV